jgi:hypothetical protein
MYGMFMPFQSSSDIVTLTADRTSTVLVERLLHADKSRGLNTIDQNKLYCLKYYHGNTIYLYNITQHYMWLISQPDGDVSLAGCSPASKHGPEPGSTMLLNYNATGAITYLHITENKADVGTS